MASDRIADTYLALALIGYELFLGIWLIVRQSSTFAWLAAMMTFLLFTAISLFRGVNGYESCGCFGVIRISPWVALSIDIAAIVFLTFARPDWSDVIRSIRAVLRLSVVHGIGVAGVLLAVAVVVKSSGKSPTGLLAQMRGSPITTSPASLELHNSEQSVQTIRLQNQSNAPVRIVGGTSDCSCTATDNLPLTLPPGGEVELPIRVTVPAGESQRWTRSIFLWTDHPEQSFVRIPMAFRPN